MAVGDAADFWLSCASAVLTHFLTEYMTCKERRDNLFGLCYYSTSFLLPDTGIYLLARQEK